MFWVAMSLIQIAHVELFPSALALLEVVLKTVFSDFIIFSFIGKNNKQTNI